MREAPQFLPDIAFRMKVAERLRRWNRNGAGDAWAATYLLDMEALDHIRRASDLLFTADSFGHDYVSSWLGHLKPMEQHIEKSCEGLIAELEEWEKGE
jgi:hypothetical protein